MAVLRDAEWVVVLGLMASVLLVTSALTNARSAVEMVLGAMAWPFAGLRGMPWLGRTLRALGGGSDSIAVIRTVVLSLLGVVVFGLLFASGDAIVGHWVSSVVPNVRGSVVFRLFLMVAVAGVVLAAAYLALNPPDLAQPVVRRPALHRFEWLAPVLLVDAVFVLFLAAQAAAFFGGHDYVQRAHRTDLRRLRPPGVRPADHRHRADAAGGVGRLPQGRGRCGRPGMAARLPRGPVRADAGRGGLRTAPDGPLPGRLRLHPAAAAGRPLRGVARTRRGRSARRRHRPARALAAQDGPAVRDGAAAGAGDRQPGRLDRAAQSRPLRGDRQGGLRVPAWAQPRCRAGAGGPSCRAGNVCPG